MSFIYVLNFHECGYISHNLIHLLTFSLYKTLAKVSRFKNLKNAIQREYIFVEKTLYSLLSETEELNYFLRL